MIAGLALMIAAYTIARLCVLPAQMHGRGRVIYASVIAVFGIFVVAFGLWRVYMDTFGGTNPSLP